MLKLSKISLGLVLLAGFAMTAEAKLSVPKLEDLPQLQPEGIHQVACTRTTNTFIRAHYKAFQVNDAFSSEVIKQYLKTLDYNKSLFTKEEVDEIYQNKARIERAILLCDMSYPYELFNTSLRKRFAKYSFFVDTLKSGKLDLSADDYLRLDIDHADYLESEEAIRHEWLNELKNDYILQLLSDKTEKEATERLERRYNAALSKLAQTSSEDVFSSFENSFAWAIDPHTSYLSPEASENFQDHISLSLEGIGAVLSSEDEYTVINSILPGSPAELSKKLKAKDRIVGVRQANGEYEDIIGWRLNDVVKKIKGPKGTKVTLDIERGEGSQMTTFSVDIIRDKIRLQDSEAKIEIEEHDGKRIAVLNIKSFYTNLHKDIRKEIERVLKDGPIDAMVVDLRNNGGGLLPEATASTGLFIKQGPVVLVRDARGNVVPQIDTDPSVAYDGPLVVLINRLSASSSEIMAAALRDYGRALLVGDTSFGKGTVQQSRPLARIYDFNAKELGSIHYTIAKFYRINGGSTQLEGVSPDIFLPTTIAADEFGERNEDNALPWDKINATSYNGYLNIDAYVPELKRLSSDRVSKDEGFKLLQADMKRFMELKDRKELSVNLEKRKAQREEDNAYNLKSTNARLALMGEKPVKDVKDLPDDFEFDDTVLNEAVAIASDFAQAQKLKLYSAQNKNLPVMMRYQVNRDALSEGTGLASPPGAAAMPARPSALSKDTVTALVQGNAFLEKVEKQREERLKLVNKDNTTEDDATASTEAESKHEAEEAAAAGDAAQVAQERSLEQRVEELLSTGRSGSLTTPDGEPYKAITATGEVNNMAVDGTLLGPWMTHNEDDTFLRQSDAKFHKLVVEYSDNSTAVHLKDSLYPNILQSRQAVAEKHSTQGAGSSRSLIILAPAP